MSADEKRQALDGAAAAGGVVVDREAEATKGESTYVVQVFDQVTTATGLGSGTAEKQCWADIATVTVPRKSPRKKVIGLALAQSGIRPTADSEPLRLRVLDQASARETEVKPFQPDAEWRL
jgi:hypothetical protein